MTVQIGDVNCQQVKKCTVAFRDGREITFVSEVTNMLYINPSEVYSVAITKE
ncbi:MAG: hypothetical protein ACM3PP_02475 [Candidatus Saccharibacteria bacterium]